MPAKRTFDAARARELHAAGRACNQIARELGCSASTVSTWAKREGLSFDRTSTALATRARVIDIAESRTLLAQKTLQVAHDTLDKLEGKYLVYSFGGRDNTYAEHELESPPIDAVRTAVTIARDAHMVATKTLEQTDTMADEAAKSLMSNMARKFGLLPEVSSDADGVGVEAAAVDS